MIKFPNVIFTFFLLISMNAFAQKVYKNDYLYNMSLGNKKQAHPDFLLENSLIDVKDMNGKFVLRIDSTESNSILLKKHITKKEHLILNYVQDSSSFNGQNYINSYIIDMKSNTKYFLTSSLSLYTNQLFYFDLLAQTKCFTLGAINKTKKREIAIFNFQDKKTSRFEISNHYELLGNNDSSVFILLLYKKTKVNNKKFKKGSLLNISSNGIKLLPFNLEKIKYEKDAPVFFYNGDYIVQCRNISKLPVGNKIETYYQLNVVHKNNILDSINCMNEYHAIEQKINIKYFDNQLHVFSPNFYKLYTENAYYTWDFDYWSSKIELLKSQTHQYFLKGDTLYLTKEIQVLDSLAFDKLTNITLNNIQLNQNSTHFKIVMAFNLKTNKFLGYPEVEFITLK